MSRMEAGPILVVEDDPDIRAVMCEVLENAGYRTTVAGQGQEALERLARGDRPALILLDVTMPVMDGNEFLSRIRKQEALRNIPVLVVSAESIKPREAQGFLEKPFELTTLLETVAQLCG